MSDSAKFPAMQSVIEFITGNIEKGGWKQGENLPTIRMIAIQTGISTPTICKAIALLKKNNVISGLAHHRIRVGKPDISRPVAQSRPLQWEQKRIAFEQELLSGVLGHRGVVPSFKEIQARYGIGFKTIQRIVQAMLVDGMIVPNGKGYALPGIPANARRQKVVYITIQNHESQQSALNQEHNRVIDAFEGECVHRRLGFEIVEIDFYDAAAARKTIAGLTNEESIQGFILDVWWYPNQSIQQGYLHTLARLASFKKPVAILDEIGSFDLPVEFSRNPLLQEYRIQAKRAGERMARFLIGLGHKSAVFISLFRDTAWSRDRFQGVLSQFSRAGFANGVHSATETGDVAIANILTVSGLVDADIRTFMRIGRTDAQAADMERSWLEFKQTNKPPYPGFPRLNAGMRDSLKGLIALARTGTDTFFFERTFAGALEAMEQRLRPAHLHSCFTQALACKDATAWICANDKFAFAALNFLRNRGIRVPQDISVVGFDNIPVQALEKRLTTFDFNAPGFIHRMLNFIIRPPKPRGSYRHAPIEIEGVIMERQTTGKANKG
jgi:DNA-binding transcriptional regulator YhcF (GntR family)